MLRRWPLLVEIGRLGSRLTAARFISLASFPLIATLYGPGPFGVFAAYLGLANIFWALMFARYELAIVPSRSEGEARAITAAALLLGSGVVVLTAVAAAVAYGYGWAAPAFGQHTAAILLLPLSLAGRGAFRLALSWATRRGEFHVIANATVAQAVAQVSVQIALAFTPLDPVVALALGDVAGNALATAAASTKMLIGRSKPGHPRPGVREIRAAMRHWSQLPLFSLPSAALAICGANLPLIFLPTLADPATAGHLALAIKLLDVPGQIVTTATTPILQHRLASVAMDERHALLLKGTGMVLALAGTAMLLLAAGGLLADPWIAGTRWHGVGAALVIALPLQLGLAVSGPLISVASVLRAELRALPVHAAFVAAIWIGANQSSDVVPAMVIFGVAALLRAGALLAVLAWSNLRRPALDFEQEQATRHNLD